MFAGNIWGYACWGICGLFSTNMANIMVALVLFQHFLWNREVKIETTETMTNSEKNIAHCGSCHVFPRELTVPPSYPSPNNEFPFAWTFPWNPPDRWWHERKKTGFIQFKAKAVAMKITLPMDLLYMVSISIVKDKLLQAHCLQSSRWSLETTFEALTLGGRLVFGKLPMQHHATSYNGIVWLFWNWRNVRPPQLGDTGCDVMNSLWECQSKLLKLKTFSNKGGYRIHLSSNNTPISRVLNRRTYNCIRYISPHATSIATCSQGASCSAPGPWRCRECEWAGGREQINIPIKKKSVPDNLPPSLSWPATCSWEVFRREASRKASKISLSCRGVMSQVQKRQPVGSRGNPSDIIWYHFTSFVDWKRLNT